MKVIICDDQAIVRDGLEMLLKLETDIDVVGMAEDGAAAVDMGGVKSTGPSVNGLENAYYERCRSHAADTGETSWG